MDYSNLFVCLMGLGTVFFGLICLILLVMLMGKICQATAKGGASASAVPTPVPAAPAPAVGPELVAAIAAAVAEDLGTGVDRIRIHSIRKI